MGDAVADQAAELIESREEPAPNADALIAAAGGGDSAGTTSGDGGATPAAAPAASPGTPAGFDPAVHVTAGGKPVKNSDGSLRKKAGRKPTRGPGGKFLKSDAVADPAAPDAAGDAGGDPAWAIPAVVDGAPVEKISREAARKAAVQLVGIGVGIGISVFGDEWNPDTIKDETTGAVILDEFAGLVSAAEEYIYANQFAGLSPGWLLLLMAGQYAGKRFQKPKTKSKLATIFGGLRKKIMGR